MELKTMTVEELELRKTEIANEVDAEDADLDALEEEAKAINEELEERRATAVKKAEIRTAVANGAGLVIEEVKTEERREMTNAEIRKSAEYINAYANYIKTNDDSECRALLTENVTGTVPVPEYVEGRVRTAWERTGLMDIIRKTYIRGNVKIGFEVSATGAVVHTEGGAAVDPENLILGTVALIPQSIKKLVQISDEALDLSGTEFLDYIYDELAYQIAKKAEEVMIQLIVNAPTTATATSPSVAEITETALGVGTIAKALGQLSAEATNPVIVTTRANWSALKAASYNANFSVDPFEGLPVHFVGASAMGSAQLIVGDFETGALANFPNGAEIDIKIDDRTDMASDLVNILGRQYVALGIVADKCFVRVMTSEA